MVIPKLKLLINLARVDGLVAQKEMKYITNIGLANGVPIAEINPLFDQDHDNIVPENLKEDERFSYLFTLVQLMKIDERLYKEEIRFCAAVASRLGYDQAVVLDLMLHVRAVMENSELAALKTLTAKYLKNNDQV